MQTNLEILDIHRSCKIYSSPKSTIVIVLKINKKKKKKKKKKKRKIKKKKKRPDTPYELLT